MELVDEASNGREAIDAAHVGKFRVPVAVAFELAGHLSQNELSARELDVLRLVAIGSSNKRVGQLLKVTEDTVKAHMKAILVKLGASDRTHAVTLAMRRGIIDPQSRCAPETNHAIRRSGVTAMSVTEQS
jgi:DNA-binding NarL/FixJ family response regulator